MDSPDFTGNRAAFPNILVSRTCTTTAMLLRRCFHGSSSVLKLAVGQETRHHLQVPLIFRERHIHSGYRPPDRSWTYYLLSLFQLHNESVNVWSHLVALVLFLARVVQLRHEVDYWPDPLAWVLLGFAIGTISYAFFSTFAHLFQSKSRIIHYTCFQIDYIGIGLNGYGNACLLYYLTGTETYYQLFSSCFMALNMLFAVMVCVCFSVAKLRYRRPYPFRRKLWQIVSCSTHVLFGGLPLFFKIYECSVLGQDDCSPRSVLRHVEYIFWFIVSTFFFASGLPERMAPGKFDLVGHGHQLFHVIMTYTSLLQYQTALLDLKSRSHHLVHLAAPSPYTIFGGIAFILAVDAMFIVYTHRHRVEKVRDDAKYDSWTAGVEDRNTCHKHS